MSTCNICSVEFNTLENLPKILPCFGLSCLKCLTETTSIQNEHLVDCKNCSKAHLIANLNDLPTSNVLSFFSRDNVIFLKEFQDNLHTYLQSENYEIYKHYDNVICDIDIRAETLIQFIHSSRDSLRQKVRDQQRKMLCLLDEDPVALDDDITTIDKETRKMISIKEKLLNLGCNKVTNIEELQLIIQEANQLEYYMHTMNKNMLYFSESSIQFEKSLLGQNLNSRFDKNLAKIKGLKEVFANLSDANKVDLSIKFEGMALRKKIFPLVSKYVASFFTCKRTIVLESFDLHGKFIKSTEVFSKINSFPVSSYFGDHFVLSFSSSSGYSVHLFDSDLNQVCSMAKKNIIESVYLNATHLLVTYCENRSKHLSQLNELYDYKFNLVNSFGQNIDANIGFYFEKSSGVNQKDKFRKSKCFARVFGMTEKYLYISNSNKVAVLDRLTGRELKKVELKGYRPYFIMDLQHNILEVNILEKRIGIYNSNLEFLGENVYNDEYEYVLVSHTPDNHLLFLDLEKKKLALI
jgi:hypothetical protein